MERAFRITVHRKYIFYRSDRSDKIEVGLRVWVILFYHTVCLSTTFFIYY